MPGLNPFCRRFAIVGNLLRNGRVWVCGVNWFSGKVAYDGKSCCGVDKFIEFSHGLDWGKVLDSGSAIVFLEPFLRLGFARSSKSASFQVCL